MYIISVPVRWLQSLAAIPLVGKTTFCLNIMLCSGQLPGSVMVYARFDWL